MSSDEVGGDKGDTDPRVRHIHTSYDDDDDDDDDGDDEKCPFQLHQFFKCFSQKTSSPLDRHYAEDDDFDGINGDGAVKSNF